MVEVADSDRYEPTNERWVFAGGEGETKNQNRGIVSVHLTDPKKGKITIVPALTVAVLIKMDYQAMFWGAP